MVGRILSILVATDHPIDADQIRTALGQNYHTIKQIPPAQLLSQPDQHTDCDCLLIRVDSPTGDELHYIPRMKQAYPHLPVLAFGNKWQIATVVQAIKLGADEVCEFPGPPEELLSAFRRILSSSLGKSSAFADLIPKSILERLNSDEARILHLLVQGRTTKEVGHTLDISIRTVHYRKKEMLRKLGVQNRSEAIELIRLSTGNIFGGLSASPTQLL